jgi:hypothetical protein
MDYNKVVINLGHLNDSDLDTHSGTIVRDLTPNVAFVFTGGALTNYTTAQNDFHNKLQLIATNGPAAVTAKDLARVVLESSFRLVAMQVNTQANGDLIKLQSTGIPLVQTGTSQPMPLPINFTVKQGDVSGTIELKVSKPRVADHGTIFAFTPLEDASADPNDWKIKHSNGHGLSIKGLLRGKIYLLTAAYKGLDTADLVWAPSIEKMVV